MRNQISFLAVAIAFLLLSSMNGYSNEITISKNVNLYDMSMELKYISSKDGFEISFSGEPEIIEEPVSDMLYGDYILARYITESSDGGEVVSVSRYPESFSENHIESETVNGCIKGYENGFGITVNSEDYKIDNKTGKLAKFQTNGMYWTAGIVFSKGKLFQILLVRMDGYPTPNEINQFIGSFKTL